MRKKIWYALVISCFLQTYVLAQTGKTDSTSSNTALQNTIDFYYASIGENAHLFIGSEYPGYNPNVIGHPYFDTTALQNGAIEYNGTLYQNIPMLYNILNDGVIINRYNQNYQILLANEKISYFSILADTFIRVVPDSNGKNLPGIGFYHRVYNGKTEVIVRRKKIIKEDPISSGAVVSRFTELDDYFVKKNNAYFHITGRKYLFRLFADKDKDVRRFLNKNKIRYKKQPEYAIVEASRYYDLLTN